MVYMLMGQDGRVGFLQWLWAELVPFVAQSPEMKMNWLVGVIKRRRVVGDELAPYMRLLLMEYQNVVDSPWAEPFREEDFIELFSKVERGVLSEMIKSTDLHDIPLLLHLLPELSVQDAIVIMTKVPPPYEEKSQIIVDKVFQAVYERSSGELLEEAYEMVLESGVENEQFVKSYQRFQEILEDEKILSSLYPQAR